MRTVRIFNAHPKHRLRHAPTAALARRVLAGEGIRDASLGVIFVNDRRMKAMNTRFLRHRSPTDVLSFPLAEPGEGALEGEVYVNLDQSKRQAAYFGVTPGEEVRRLVVHGVLHLAGYRDGTERERQGMRRKEDDYLFSDRNR
jgi:probable rRNA maturation factor